ncbi:MAG: S8 family serine peptidase [Deltaproteobacteria bacterium]|nr:S8 family serine peptidase [Deltaproteobacteria bacterium]
MPKKNLYLFSFLILVIGITSLNTQVIEQTSQEDLGLLKSNIWGDIETISTDSTIKNRETLTDIPGVSADQIRMPGVHADADAYVDLYNKLERYILVHEIDARAPSLVQKYFELKHHYITDEGPEVSAEGFALKEKIQPEMTEVMQGYKDTFRDEVQRFVDNNLKVMLPQREVIVEEIHHRNQDPRSQTRTQNNSPIVIRYANTSIPFIEIEGISLQEATALKNAKKTKNMGWTRMEKVQPVSIHMNDSAMITNTTPLYGKPGPTSPNGKSTMLDGSGTTIAIIDTGIDYTHPDLGGCLGNACKVIGGYDFYNDDPDPMDERYHGTHVAAIAAGVGSYTQGTYTYPILGQAPGARLFALKVTDPAGFSTSTLIINAIEASADPNGDGLFNDRVDVVNISMGGGGNPLDLQSAALDMISQTAEILFVVSAGNNGPYGPSISSPGVAAEAITVAAACDADQIGNVSYTDLLSGEVIQLCDQPIALFSSRGPVFYNGVNYQKPNISAPGVQICAARKSGYSAAATCLDAAHIALDGTSMAAPQVAGIAAILRQMDPNFTNQQIKNALYTSAIDLGMGNNAQGHGMVDAFGAYNELFPSANLSSGLGSFQIQNMPLVLNIDPMFKVTQFSPLIGIENQAKSSASFQWTSLNNLPQGITSTAGPLWNIASGQIDGVPTNIFADHMQIHKGNYSTDFSLAQTLNNNTLNFDIPGYLQVQPKLKADIQSIDFGVHSPKDPSGNFLPSPTILSQKIKFVNKLSDHGLTYTVNVSSLPAGLDVSLRSSLSGSASSSIYFGPGVGKSRILRIDVDNTIVKPGRYDGKLELISPSNANGVSEVLSIPFTVFIGYQIEFHFLGTEIPFEVQLFQPYQNGMTETEYKQKKIHIPFIFAPKSAITTFNVLEQGTHWALAQYASQGNEKYRWVIKEQIPVFQNVTTVNIDINQSNHVLNLQALDPTGSDFNRYWTRQIRLLKKQPGHGTVFVENNIVLGGTSWPSTDGFIRINDLSSDFTIAINFGASHQGGLGAPDSYLYQGYLANGIFTDKALFDYTQLTQRKIHTQVFDPAIRSASYLNYIRAFQHQPSYSPYGEAWDPRGYGNRLATNTNFATVYAHALIEADQPLANKTYRDWPLLHFFAEDLWNNASGKKYDIKNNYGGIGVLFDPLQMRMMKLLDRGTFFKDIQVPLTESYLWSHELPFHDNTLIPLGIGLATIKPEANYSPGLIQGSGMGAVSPLMIRVAGEMAAGPFSKCGDFTNWAGNGTMPVNDPSIASWVNSQSFPAVNFGSVWGYWYADPFAGGSGSGELKVQFQADVCAEGQNRLARTVLVNQVDSSTYTDTPPYLQSVVLMSQGLDPYVQNGITTTDKIDLYFRALSSHPEHLGQGAYLASTHELLNQPGNVQVHIKKGSQQFALPFTVDVDPNGIDFHVEIDPTLLFDPSYPVPNDVTMSILLTDIHGNIAQHGITIPVVSSLLEAP